MAENGQGSRDAFFIKVLMILGAIVACFGLVAILLAIYAQPSDPIILRVIGGFGAMFSGLVGLSIGYLSGRNGK